MSPSVKITLTNPRVYMQCRSHNAGATEGMRSDCTWQHMPQGLAEGGDGRGGCQCEALPSVWSEGPIAVACAGPLFLKP